MRKLYDFKCKYCGKVEEVMATANTVRKCSDCDLPMARMIPAPGMIRGNAADKPRVK